MIQFNKTWDLKHFNFKDQIIHRYIQSVLESILLLNITELNNIEEKRVNN